jgi:Polyphosphate kinase 2 (PPK2)
MPTQEVLDYGSTSPRTAGKGFRLKESLRVTPAACSWTRATRRSCCKTGTAWLRTSRTCSTPRTAGPRRSSSRRWMRRARNDGTIKYVMSGVNPQGCQVYSFKQPSSEELNQDFMWCYFRYLRPARIAQGTGEALHLAPRRAGEELEVLAFRRAGTQVLGGLDARLRGSDRRNGDEARAVVRRAGRCSVGSSSPRLSWRQW